MSEHARGEMVMAVLTEPFLGKNGSHARANSFTAHHSVRVYLHGVAFVAMPIVDRRPFFTARLIRFVRGPWKIQKQYCTVYGTWNKVEVRRDR